MKLVNAAALGSANVYKLFNCVAKEGKTQSDWLESTTVRIWKKERNPAESSNCHPIRLLPHTMKIF